VRSITCPCDATFDADLPDEIDLDEEESKLDEIVAGTFMVVTCPKCGRKLKPEPRLRLRSTRRPTDLFTLPESERFSFYGGFVEIPKGCEVLIGFPELYERALLLAAGLDATAVEVLKYYLLAKAVDTQNSSDEVVVSFAGRQEDGKLRFQIAGLREGEIAILALPYDRYEKALRDLARTAKTEPFARIFEGPYRSVRALEMSGD
jgi:hypothetical protein